MNTVPFLAMDEPYDQALSEVTRRLSGLGLRVIVTFDLQAARYAEVGCSCPQHGTDKCDCRLGVLLIYGKGSQPAPLLAHGHEGRTWFSLADTPQQPIDPSLSAKIRGLFSLAEVLPTRAGG